jgi:hypothetical protein
MKFLFVPAFIISFWCSGALAQPAAAIAPPAESPVPQADSPPAAPATPPLKKQRALGNGSATAGNSGAEDPANVVKKDNWVCNIVATRFDIWRLELVLQTLSTYRIDSCTPESMHNLTTASASAQLKTIPGYNTIIKGGANQQVMDINLTPISSEYYWVSNLKFSPSGTSRISLGQLYQTTKLGSTKNIAGASYVPFKLKGETHFIWNAGSLVHRLVSPEGSSYIMFSYTRDVQPSLTRDTLSNLNDMLKLPIGWVFENFFLDKTIVVRAGLENEGSIVVVFDDLNNYYVRYE